MANRTYLLKEFIALTLVAATGCGGAPPPSAAVAATTPSAVDEAAPAAGPGASRSGAPAPTAVNAKTTPSDAKNTSPTVADDSLIMYSGDVVLGVDNDKLGDTIDRITDVAESVGGHLAGRRDQGVTVRVPSSRFREALAKVSALGEITHESVTAEDVSEEYHDAEVRLANLKASRQRLQEFLAKSASMSDMLTLEHELERVTMDIDRIEGRMRYLREHSAYSTLSVALVARAKGPNQIAGGGNVKPTSPRVMHLKAAWLEDMGVPKLFDAQTTTTAAN
jgi:Domain of unknown function (DUF4349)